MNTKNMPNILKPRNVEEYDKLAFWELACCKYRRAQTELVLNTCIVKQKLSINSIQDCMQPLVNVTNETKTLRYIFCISHGQYF